MALCVKVRFVYVACVLVKQSSDAKWVNKLDHHASVMLLGQSRLTLISSSV